LSFAITGFAGEQFRATPQTFQALSLGGAGPVPPAPPYGTPNTQLVPVSRPSAAPANLTIAAQPAFAAILNLGVVGVGQPGIQPPSNSTAAVNALNPGVQNQILGPVNGTPIAKVASGPVSFTFAGPPAFITTGLTALQKTLEAVKPVSLKPGLSPAQTPLQTNSTTSSQPQQAAPPPPVESSAPSLPPSSTPQYVLPSSPNLIARITSTVAQIAIAAVYPAPIFSFSA